MLLCHRAKPSGVYPFHVQTLRWSGPRRLRVRESWQRVADVRAVGEWGVGRVSGCRKGGRPGTYQCPIESVCVSKIMELRISLSGECALHSPPQFLFRTLSLDNVRAPVYETRPLKQSGNLSPSHFQTSASLSFRSPLYLLHVSRKYQGQDNPAIHRDIAMSRG